MQQFVLKSQSRTEKSAIEQINELERQPLSGSRISSDFFAGERQESSIESERPDFLIQNSDVFTHTLHPLN